MNKTLTGVLTTLTLVLGLIVAAPASAATLTVDDDNVECPAATFATISAAVAAANDGDVIEVCAGTYTEQVNIDEQVEIRGAQAGVDARTPRTGAESVLEGEFAFAESGVTVDGFTVTYDPVSANDAGFYLPNNRSDQQVINNIITDHVTGINLQNQFVTVLPRQTVIRHNLISDNNEPGFPTSGNGIYGNFGIESVAIDENTFTNNEVASIQLQTTLAAFNIPRPVSNVRITDNQMDKQVRITNGRDITITGNNLDISPGGGLDPPQNGIQLDSNNRRVLISDNSISGATDADTGAISFTNLDFPALGIAPVPSEDVTITSNTLVDNEAGVLVGESGGDPAYSGLLRVHFNRIAGNDSGIELNSNALVNAANNWWGCNAGPSNAACDSVEGDFENQIDYTPWLVLRITAAPTTIYEGTGQSQVVADLTRNSDGVIVGPGFPDNTQVVFGTNLGSIAPNGTTENGRADATLSAPPAGTGIATVNAALDNQLVTTQVAIVPVLPPAAAAAVAAATAASAAGKCHTKAATIVGTEGDDLLVGTSERDVIQGKGGDDEIYGQTGADLICGGGGADKLYGNEGADRLLGGRGIDLLRGGAGPDRKFGGSPVTPGAGHNGS